MCMEEMLGNQRQHIERVEREAKRRQEDGVRIQELYEKCVQKFDNYLFSELCDLIERSTGPWVRKKLLMSKSYNEDNEFNVLQEARLGVYQAILRANRDNNVKEYFVGYAFMIYKNKTISYITKLIKEPDLVYFEEEYGWPEPWWIDEDSDKAKAYNYIFKQYCCAFMNSDEFPTKSIALFFARILPHMYGMIPDDKQASAKWAHQFMGNRTIDELRDLSERILTYYLKSPCKWGTAFLEQLEKGSAEFNIDVPLKTVVYTQQFDSKQTSHWADHLHRPTVRATYQLIAQDGAMLDWIKEYIYKYQTKLYEVISGGKK